MTAPIPARDRRTVGRFKCPDCPYASDDVDAAFCHLMSDCPVKRVRAAGFDDYGVSERRRAK